MLEVNLKDTAYYLEEAAALRDADARGRHGGTGPEVPAEELEEDDGEYCE